MSGGLRPEAPFCWPDPDVLAGRSTYAVSPPYESIALAASAMFGMVVAPASDGVALLMSWFKRPDFVARVIVDVFPTCPTTESDLEALRALESESHGQHEVRLVARPGVGDRGANVLCFLQRSTGPKHIVIGPTTNLGLDILHPAQANLAFQADDATVDAFNAYFCEIWEAATPIAKPGAISIPSLVLPLGTDTADANWHDYRAQLAASTPPPPPQVVLEARREAAAVPVAPLRQPPPLPTEALGLKPPDGLATAIARLHQKGLLVTIDKHTRVPPLDAPLSPSLFGESAEVQRGALTRRVSMRIQVIDEATSREIEKRRKALRGLLEKFTFPLADGVRWMPRSARPLFESAAERVDSEARELVDLALLQGGKCDIDTYVNQRRSKVEDDIAAMLKPGSARPSKVQIDEVLETLKERLKKATGGRFLPTLAYSQVGFSGIEDKGASPWGQALTFLLAIAEYPRRGLTDRFFWQGLKVDEDDLLRAMDVAGDRILADETRMAFRRCCQEDLAVLARIEHSTLTPRERCELVLQLIHGSDASAVGAELDRKEAAGPTGVARLPKSRSAAESAGTRGVQ